MSEYDRTILLSFAVGMPIVGTNGAKRPPDRFKKKLSEWKSRNFTGYVTELGEPRSYEPFGSITYKRDDYPDRSYMKFSFHDALSPRCGLFPAAMVVLNPNPVAGEAFVL